MSRLGAINNLYKLRSEMQKYKLLKCMLKRQAKQSVYKNKLPLSNSQNKISKLASAVRVKNRCFITGRARGYYKAFGVSRIMLRQMACFGLMPGVNKSSW
ncbi:MAG: 30S ribosomal protein S14 [Candidatus Hodgkinia cicadicola]